jgi:hypothetical protein
MWHKFNCYIMRAQHSLACQPAQHVRAVELGKPFTLFSPYFGQAAPAETDYDMTGAATAASPAFINNRLACIDHGRQQPCSADDCNGPARRQDREVQRIVYTPVRP